MACCKNQMPVPQGTVGSRFASWLYPYISGLQALLTLRPVVQIHWFSIFNSFMMVIFLTGLVSMILLRTLRADYARYTAVRSSA